MSENLSIIDIARVVDVFGYWPQFCDAKLRSFLIDLEKECINIVLFYIDVDKSLSRLITLKFDQIQDVKLNDIFSENVFDSVTINHDDNNQFKVDISGCYGLNGGFSCSKIFVDDISEP